MSFTSAILSPSFLNLNFLGLFAAGACASASESESCILRLAGGIAMCRLLQLASAACNLRGRFAQVPSEQRSCGQVKCSYTSRNFKVKQPKAQRLSSNAWPSYGACRAGS